jgi:hypothetical protein
VVLPGEISCVQNDRPMVKVQDKHTAAGLKIESFSVPTGDFIVSKQGK